MKYRGVIPGIKELHADKWLSRAEHGRWLRVCEMGEKLALHLHGPIKCRSVTKAEAALRAIIDMADVQKDGSFFDCAFCWESARQYLRTGHLSLPTKARHTYETVDELQYLKCHL